MTTFNTACRELDQAIDRREQTGQLPALRARQLHWTLASLQENAARTGQPRWCSLNLLRHQAGA